MLFSAYCFDQVPPYGMGEVDLGAERRADLCVGGPGKRFVGNFACGNFSAVPKAPLVTSVTHTSINSRGHVTSLISHLAKNTRLASVETTINLKCCISVFQLRKQNLSISPTDILK